MPWILLALLHWLPAPVVAMDLAGERAWAAALERSPLAGERLWLQAGGIEFPALWRPSQRRDTAGAVVLLPGRGAHPAWPEAIEPLRRGLPRRGWATLSLPLPGPGEPGGIALARARLEAALAFLAKRGIRNIALAGHREGALLAAWFASRRPEDSALQAVVFLSLPRPSPADPALDGADLIRRIDLPMLDVVGEWEVREDPGWLAARLEAASRAPAPEGMVPLAPSPRSRGLSVARSGNPGYRQVIIPGGGADFSDREAWLGKVVSSWLNRVAPGMELADAP